MGERLADIVREMAAAGATEDQIEKVISAAEKKKAPASRARQDLSPLSQFDPAAAEKATRDVPEKQMERSLRSSPVARLGEEYDEDGFQRDLSAKPRDYVPGLVGALAGGGVGSFLLKPAAGFFLSRIGASALGGAAGGAAGGATEAAFEGKPIGAGAMEGGALGALVGGGIQGGAELARGTSNLVRRTSPWVKRYGEARESGDIARLDPGGKLTAASPEGVKSSQEAADKAQKTIFSRNAEKLEDAGKAHASATAAAAKDQDASPIVQRLTTISQSNRTTRTGKVRDKSLEDAVNEAFDMMDIDPRSGMARTEDIIAARRAIQERAQFGQPATRENMPYRQLYGVLSEGVQASNPALAMADEAFSAQAAESKRLTDILARSETKNAARGSRAAGEPDMRAGKEVSAAQRIQRIGDDTRAGSAEERQIKEVMEMDPAYRRALQDVLAVKSREATSFGTNQVTGPLSRLLSFWGGPFIGQNLRFLGARVVDPLATGAAEAGTKLAPVVGGMMGASLEAGRRRRELLRQRGSK